MVSRNDRNEIYAAGVIPSPLAQADFGWTSQRGRRDESRIATIAEEEARRPDDWTDESEIKGAFNTVQRPFPVLRVEDTADTNKPTDPRQESDPDVLRHAADIIVEALVTLYGKLH